MLVPSVPAGRDLGTSDHQLFVQHPSRTPMILLILTLCVLFGVGLAFFLLVFPKPPRE